MAAPAYIAFVSTTTFYTDLPETTSFQDLFDERAFRPAPDDWWILVVDIRGSTGLIEAGRYRDVNFVGASSIAAARNASSGTDLPYVFGGDGATLLLPESERVSIGRAMLGLVATVRREFDMELHIGMVSVADMRAVGHELLVARYRVAPGYVQAVFQGAAISVAEQAVKSSTDGNVYRMMDLQPSEADFTGLECRWKRIESRRGETVSLIVQASSLDEYRRLLTRLTTIYGSEEERHPVLPQDLRASFNFAELARREPRLRRPPGRRWLYTIRIWLQQFLLLLFIRLDLTVGNVEWKKYLPTLSETTDIRKFDGVLRMVLAGSPAQREELVGYLNSRFEAGTFVWGLHVSDGALMTCLVYERLGDQVHFVDGSQGGYAMAAADLKRRQAAKDPTGA